MALLFDGVVFGPIESRRFGHSLGINLLPLTNKVCNFNCVYCECGWTELKTQRVLYFHYEIVCAKIKSAFQELAQKSIPVDCITFAGNGEPSMHPQFNAIIDKVIDYRNTYLPGRKIVVLSNAALAGNPKVVEALQKADLRVLKLDAGSDAMFQKIDQPLSGKSIDWQISKLKAFKGRLIIQTIFLKGWHNGERIDNTEEQELELWIKTLKEIQPESVMIYTLDRPAPEPLLEKVQPAILDMICMRVEKEGIPCKVYL
ncbi:MAG: radical SAM protein [Bacteroidia bacterium]|jgi:wyosine [tRNA(Phe)-imidazoG37] synthetase (radical SAM superfamily)|nr:radical SAM protein [Bacteroidia bacterium]